MRIETGTPIINIAIELTDASDPTMPVAFRHPDTITDALIVALDEMADKLTGDQYDKSREILSSIIKGLDSWIHMTTPRA